MEKETKQQVIKCSWHGCPEPTYMGVPVKIVVKEGEKFKPTGKAMPVNFCEYHIPFAIGNMCMATASEGPDNQVQLYVPGDQVRMMEVTIEALLFSGKFDKIKEQVIETKKKMDKFKQDQEAELKKVKQEDETKAKNDKQDADKPTDSDGDKQRPEVQQEQSTEKKSYRKQGAPSS